MLTGGQAEVAMRHTTDLMLKDVILGLQRSASMCYSRENGWVKIKRQERGCSPTERIPSIPRVCREAGGQSHSTKAWPRTGWENKGRLHVKMH